jgi:cytochrome c-type biogenesis protein CcmH/NrfF
MSYFWLIPILVIALMALVVLARGSRRQPASPLEERQHRPEAIKRGRFFNKK